MRRHRARLTGTALLMCAGLLITGCGDDDDGDEQGGAMPTGQPIEIGFVNTENSPAGSYPDVRFGAEAAVEYVNTELGGVAGRPLAMETCIANGSGESSIACANRFVQEGKVAVSYGFDFGGGASMPIYTEAGMPVVGGLATELPQLAAPNAFLFVGGITGAVPSISRYVAEELEPERVAILAADIPASRLAIDRFARPILEQFGVTEINAIFEDPTAADYTPALTAANDGDPGAIMVFFGGQSCAKIMQGSQSLGIPTNKMIYLQVCTARDQLQAGGAGAEGILAQTPYLVPGSSHEDVETYRDAMAQYRPDAPVGPNSQAGFSQIMNFYNVLTGIQGDISRQSIATGLETTTEQQNFMSHPYTCSRPVVSDLPSICNTNERIVRIDNGDFEDVTGEWINGISLLSP